jgi:hypothetical protein
LFETSKEMVRPIIGMALAKSDLIKLFKVNSNVKTLVREMIISMWSKGIQAEYEIKCGYAIKLKGRVPKSQQKNCGNLKFDFPPLKVHSNFR